MACANCAANVERALSRLEGVRSAAVNLAGRTVLVDYEPQALTPEALKQQVSSAGYDLVVEDDRDAYEEERQALRILK